MFPHDPQFWFGAVCAAASFVFLGDYVRKLWRARRRRPKS